MLKKLQNITLKMEIMETYMNHLISSKKTLGVLGVDYRSRVHLYRF